LDYRGYGTYKKIPQVMLFQLVAFLFFVLSLVVAFLSLILVAAFMELVSPSFWFSHITMGVFTFGSFYLCGLV